MQRQGRTRWNRKGQGVMLQLPSSATSHSTAAAAASEHASKQASKRACPKHARTPPAFGLCYVSDSLISADLITGTVEQGPLSRLAVVVFQVDLHAMMVFSFHSVPKASNASEFTKS
jgi:hypothetical protein